MRFLSAALTMDRRALETLGRALRGSDRPLVAALHHGDGAWSTRHRGRPHDPDAAGGLRGSSEDIMRALASEGIRTAIIRLPPIIHGVGDRAGLTPRVIQTARKKHESGYVGDGLNRWASVHRLDAAHLFCLALEKGTAGAAYHGVAEEGIPFRDIAALIGPRLNVPVASKSAAQAAKRFSFLAPFISADNPVSSNLTQKLLG